MAEEPVKLIALEGFCIGKGVDVYPGDEFEATKGFADMYIRQGRAEEASTSKKKKKKEGE